MGRGGGGSGRWGGATLLGGTSGCLPAPMGRRARERTMEGGCALECSPPVFLNRIQDLPCVSPQPCELSLTSGGVG